MQKHPFRVIEGNSHPHAFTEILFDNTYSQSYRESFEEILRKAEIKNAFVQSYTDSIVIRFVTEQDKNTFLEHACKPREEAKKPHLSVVNAVSHDDYPISYSFQLAALDLNPESALSSQIKRIGIQDFHLYTDYKKGTVEIFLRSTEDMMAIYAADKASHAQQKTNQPKREP